jgi:hypothetical protein
MAMFFPGSSLASWLAVWMAWEEGSKTCLEHRVR